jgi:hypothetical protein
LLSREDAHGTAQQASPYHSWAFSAVNRRCRMKRLSFQIDGHGIVR